MEAERQEAAAAALQTKRALADRLAVLEAKLEALLAKRDATEPQRRHELACVEELERSCEEMQSELSALPFDGAQYAAMVKEEYALDEKVFWQEKEVETLKNDQHVQRSNFVYDPPEPNFDARRVHGTVASLITVNNPLYLAAVEGLVETKLFHVVVDTQETAFLLMAMPNLPHTHFIACDTVDGSVDPDILAVAQDLGGGPEAVQPAINLVSFPEAVAPVVRWLLNRSLVVLDMKMATSLGYDKRVLSTCVTLGGDLVGADGRMTGGPRDCLPVLRNLDLLATAERVLQEDRQRLHEAKAVNAPRLTLYKPYLALKKRLNKTSEEAFVKTTNLAKAAHAADTDIGIVEAEIAELKRVMQGATNREAAVQPVAPQMDIDE